MRARAATLAVIAVLAVRAHADPAPKPVDIKPFRDQLIVLQDANGGTYVLVPGISGPVFFGPAGGPFHQQLIGPGSRDGDTWQVSVSAPRAPHPHLAGVQRKADGSYIRWCSQTLDEVGMGLTEVTGSKAKEILKGKFLTTLLVRVPVLFARDDVGTYYYVDRLSQDYGGNGYRMFVGKKGAMKSLAVTDLTSDERGIVITTRTGVLSVVHESDDSSKIQAKWIRGDKRTELITLDVYQNSHVIYRDLGIYGDTGTICGEL